MKRKIVFLLGLLCAIFLFPGAPARAAAAQEQNKLERIVNEVIQPLMAENDIPGMAVAVTYRGERYAFNYGVASKESGQKVTSDTLFEIGSVSKTFTATLAGYAQVNKSLSLSDNASLYLPELKGSYFDEITLLELGTYTAGGLPLQFPDSVKDLETMIAYYKNWRPAYAAGTQRLYSNPSIGLLGYLAAKSLGRPFDELMEKTLFPQLGLKNTFIRVPEDLMDRYAYGYSKAGRPVRFAPGVLGSEAYGVKTTASDLANFLDLSMNLAALEDTMRQAVATTHTGYFQIGGMVQGLGWEMYSYPTDLNILIAGNSPSMIFEPNKAVRLSPPCLPETAVLYNKTGSTNGFGAYLVFIPAKQLGLVMLANRNYPNQARIKAAHQILTALEAD